MDLKKYMHTSFYCASWMLHFVLIEGNLSPSKNIMTFYWDVCFIAVVCDPNPQYLQVKNNSYISK